LKQIKRWANTLGVAPEKVLLMGDFNIPSRKIVAGLKWNVLTSGKTFPSWQPKVEIDFMLSQTLTPNDVEQVSYPHAGMSDHLPLQIVVDAK
jgi:endonuclease/exonuclease/phosphatase family metal-dependent hydrolase